jgi:hypothetical protein
MEKNFIKEISPGVTMSKSTKKRGERNINEEDCFFEDELFHEIP